jgi:hypothetical protein
VRRPRVALIVTGQLELRALPAALERLFPHADFFVPDAVEGRDLFDSTSTRVDPARNAVRYLESPPKIDALVADLAAALCDDADFAVLVEDLELHNRGNEHNVLTAVREAVQRHVARTAQRRAGKRDLGAVLRERAS